MEYGNVQRRAKAGRNSSGGGGSIETVVARADPSLGARVVAATPLAGVTAGSALLAVEGGLVAIHDDAFRVSRIALPGLAVTPFVLAGDGAALPKSVKPDFECALHGEAGAIYVLGSGATPRRCAIARIDLAAGRVMLADRADVYDALERVLGSPPNVEGAVRAGETLRLFHRGTGPEPSAIVDVPLAVLDGAAPAVLGVQRFDLGALDGVRLGFTDAAAPSGRTMFTAAAEDTADAIADGAVTGSVIGALDVLDAAPDAAARWTRLVAADGSPWRYKVEGFALDDDLAGAWILTDADDPAIPTVLARVALTGFRA